MILLSIELEWRRRADLVHQTLRLTIKRHKVVQTLKMG